MNLKNLIYLIQLLFISSTSFSQGNISYHLQVKDNDNTPVSNLSVSALETTSFRTVTGSTDMDGITTLTLNEGKDWVISIGEIKKCIYVSAVPYSELEMQEVYIYDLNDYLRQQEQDQSRTNHGFKIIEQLNEANTEFESPNCMLIVKMRDPNNVGLGTINIDIVNTIDSLIYRSKTDKDGNAYFILPNQNNYDIDINELKNYTYSDFGDEFVIRPLTIKYAPTVVEENVINDTVHQYVTAADFPSSERALVKIYINGGKKNGKGEAVYLRELNSGKVYGTKANMNGEAYFLVPIKQIYMVDFNYQKDADAINLKHAKELTRGEINVLYKPDPRLEYPEKFIPTSDQLFLKSFNSFLTAQYEKPTNKPFILNVLPANNINTNSEEALFKLTLSTSSSYGGFKRLPLNVAFVIDQSGSMYSHDRSEAVKKSLWSIGNALNNKDIVSVVLFDNEANTVLKSYINHLNGFEVVIDNYSPSGGTNIFKGLQTGVSDLSDEFDVDKSNRIILLTDGYGITPPKEITDYVAEQSEKGIEFSAIGLGNNYNQALLELIAQEGNGTFNYVDNSVELSDVFLKEVKDAFNYFAKDLKVEVFYDENMIFSNLYGYPTTNQTDGQVSFEIGKLPANVNQIAFLKFKLNKPKEEIKTKPILIKVSYFDLIQNTEVNYEETVYLNWTEETNTELILSQEEKTMYAIAILNQSLKLMAEAHELNDVTGAKKALKDGIRQIEAVFPEAKPKEVKSLFNELTKYLKLFEQIEKNED